MLCLFLITMWSELDNKWELNNRIVYGRKHIWQNKSLYNSDTGEIYIKDVDEIYPSLDGDSILVYFKGAKRGLFNYYTGEIVSEPIYDAAWRFKNGLGAVCIGDSVFFVDSKGKKVGDISFPRYSNWDPTFSHSFMIANYKGKQGVLNKKIEWVIEPLYEDIEYKNGYWRAISTDKLSVFDTDFNEVFKIDNLQEHIDSITDFKKEIKIINCIASGYYDYLHHRDAKTRGYYHHQTVY